MSVHSTLALLVQKRRLDQKKMQWIRNHVRKRECVSYTSGDDEPSHYGQYQNGQMSDENGMCLRCGRLRKDHKMVGEPVRSRDYRMFTKPFPTDVCVETVNSNSMQLTPMAYSPKQIVRIAADTDPDVLRELLGVWRVPKANFMLGLYGDYQTLPKSGEESFLSHLKQLLTVLANPSNVLVTMSTTDEGLYGLGRKASSEFFDLLPSSEIIPMAFLQWSDLTLNEKDFLLRASASGQAVETGDISREELPSSILSFLKGYFFLADYGVEKMVQKHNYVFPIPLRRRVEDLLRQHTHDAQSQGSFMLLVGGAFPDLAAVHGALLSGVPVVIVRNSGGAADILDHVLKETEGQVETRVVQEDGKTVRRSRTVADTKWLQELVEEQSGKKLDRLDFRRYQSLIGRVVANCLAHRHLLTTCDLTTLIDSPHPVLVEAAVEAFIKSLPDEDGVSFIKKNVYQLATEAMEHPVKKAQLEFQASIIRVAIRLDRADLLEVIVNHGFVTEAEAINKQFWTDAREISDFCAFNWRQTYAKAVVAEQRDLSEVTVVQHLFLWAVLNNKLSLAVHFWKRGTDQIANALIAVRLSKHMADPKPDGQEKNLLEEQASEFESLAIGTLGECYRQDPEQAIQILKRKASPFPITPMEAAVWFDIRSFIAEPAAAAYLDSVWKGQEREKERERERERVSRLAMVATETKQSDLGCCESFCLAPRTKCAIISVFYVLFLVCFGHVLIFELGKELSPWDIVLAAWVGSLILEEFVTAFNPAQFLSRDRSRSGKMCQRIMAHFDDPWNYVDVTGLVLFVIGFVLHFVPGPAAMTEVGRVLLCLDYPVFFVRLLKSLTASRSIGPMLPMIWNMLGDLFPFLVILFIFVFAYAVASEALLHPGTDWHPLYLLFLPRSGFWPIFGEYGLDTVEGGGECVEDKSWYVTAGDSRCPTPVGRHVVPVLLGLYILVTNVLMLNLLIAYFNHSFEKVHAKSNIWWAWLRCGLLREYYGLAPVPPPFTVLYRLGQLVVLLCKRCRDCCLWCFSSVRKRRARRDNLLPDDDRPGMPEMPLGCVLRRACPPGDYGMMPTSIQLNMAFREDGDVLEVIELDDFRFTSLGRPNSGLQPSAVVHAAASEDISKVWETTRAAVYLAFKTATQNTAVTNAGSVGNGDKQKAQDIAELMSRLEKKIEDNKIQLEVMNSVLEKFGPMLPHAEDAASAPDEAVQDLSGDTLPAAVDRPSMSPEGGNQSPRDEQDDEREE